MFSLCRLITDALCCCLCLVVIALIATIGCNRNKIVATRGQEPEAIVGRVTHDFGPVSNANVRIKGTQRSTLSDSNGRFVLPIDDVIRELTITAWKSGFFIGSAEHGGSSDVTIELNRHPTKDYDRYEWVDPVTNPDGLHNCANCHAEIYDEWKSGAHANAASGRHFLNLYEGSDWHGRANRGWSLLTEYPHGATVCSSCHAPSASMEQLVTGDIRSVTGVAQQGVHCDFCHKIQNVSTENVGIAHGRFGINLLRPDHNQLFFGPFDDVDRGEDIFTEQQSKSEFCSSCHEGIVFGVHVYSTYSEWLSSPARKKGSQCQDCHMKPSGEMTNMAPAAGGIERDPKTLASHRLFGGDKVKMIRDCLHVQVDIDSKGSESVVTVAIEPRNVGHSVPTGYIDRHLILLVDGFDSAGERITLKGNVLPTPAGDFAGRTGRLFAKRLVDEQGKSPIPFWRPAVETIDTRLMPEQIFTDQYRLPANVREIDVQIVYRRFWHEVYLQKQWPNDQFVVYQKRLKVKDKPRQ